MNCKRYEADIALHAGGDLGARGNRRLERHLAICPQCRDYAEAFRRSLAVIRHAAAAPIDPELGAGLAESVMSAVQAGERRKPRRTTPLFKAAGIAAAAGILFLSAYLFNGRAPAPAAPAPPDAAAATPVQAPATPPQPRKPVVVKVMTDDPRVVFVMLTD